MSNITSPDKEITKRVVFGLNELREKLLAQDAELDDRMVELMKLLVVYEHPFLLQKNRLRLIFNGVDQEAQRFIAYSDHSKEAFEVNLPLAITDPLMDDESTFRDWTNNNLNNDLFTLDDSDDFWVNFWRWSPVTWSLSHLADFSQAIEDGQSIDLDSDKFAFMVKYLPQGNNLPTQAKRQLRVVYKTIKAEPNQDGLERQLFEIRFGFGLEDDWALNDDPNDIDTLWNLLKDLPDTNVEGNSAISELLLDKEDSGGWYSPGTFQIGIGDELLLQRIDDRERRHH